MTMFIPLVVCYRKAFLNFNLCKRINNIQERKEEEEEEEEEEEKLSMDN